MDDFIGKAKLNISYNKSDIQDAIIIGSKDVDSNFRLDPMNQQMLNVAQSKLSEKIIKPTKGPDKAADKKDSSDIKFNQESLQQLNSEHQVRAMIQMTYRKLAEDFRRLEELMKKQEEVENKLKEERTEKIDGLNNIITIENVHSGTGNFTRVTLCKRKVNEIRHRMPLPAGKNHTKQNN